MMMMSLRSLRTIAALSSMISLAACAKHGTDPSLANGANGANGLNGAGAMAAPGTQQDFVVNVGDRVLFLEDQADLTGEAQGILSKQARWLKTYPSYSVTIEGHADERGTREYNI